MTTSEPQGGEPPPTLTAGARPSARAGASTTRWAPIEVIHDDAGRPSIDPADALTVRLPVAVQRGINAQERLGYAELALRDVRARHEAERAGEEDRLDHACRLARARGISASMAMGMPEVRASEISDRQRAARRARELEGPTRRAREARLAFEAEDREVRRAELLEERDRRALLRAARSLRGPALRRWAHRHTRRPVVRRGAARRRSPRRTHRRRSSRATRAGPGGEPAGEDDLAGPRAAPRLPAREVAR